MNNRHKQFASFSDFLLSINIEYEKLQKELTETLNSLPKKQNSQFYPNINDSQLYFVHFYMLYPPHDDKFFHVFAKNREEAISKVEKIYSLDSLDFDYHDVKLVSLDCYKNSNFYFLEGTPSKSNSEETFSCFEFLEKEIDDEY